MAKVTTDLTVVIKTAGDAGLDKLTRTLNGLGRQAKSAAAPFDQISKELKDVQRTSKNSIANLRGYRNAWRDITEQVEIGSKAFKEATAEAARLDKQLQKAEGRKGRGGGGLGGKLRSIGGVASTALGAGVFGGVEGFGGAIAGGLIGGVPGAAAGAVAGASLGQLRQQASGMGELVARVNGLKIALAGVSTSQEDYNVSIKSAIGFSKDFLIPIDDTIKQYTRLKAAVVGAGGTTKDTDQAFRGMAAAVLATGGNVQDFNSALVATAQVFSKGKVSAEELRQQIGERLPGAFTIFADAMGISTRELDKLLEQGKVDLTSFGGFTRELFERFGKTAEILGDAPEKAGQRLQVALSFAALEYGGFFQKVGAGFQDYATNLVNFAINNKETFKEVLANAIVFANDIQEIFKRASQAIVDAFVIAGDFIERNFKPILDKVIPAVEGLAKLILRADAESVGRPVPRGEKSLEQKLTEARGTVDSFFAPFDPTSFGTGTKAGTQSLAGGDDDASGGASKLSKFYRQAQSEFNKFVRELEKGDKLSVKLLTKATQNNALLGTRNKLERINTQFTIDTSNALQKYQEILSGNLTDEARINLEKARGIELTNLEIQKRKDLKAIFEAAGADFANFAIKQNKELTDTDKLFKQIENTLSTSIASGLQSLIDGAKTLKEVFSDILKQLASVFLQAAVKSAVGSLFANQNGNVIAQNKIVPYAAGGVVSKPTIFPLANGTGLMAEAGPEAIMPLKRGPSGRLGVEVTNQGSAREAMNRYSRRNNGSVSERLSGEDSQPGSALQTAGPIDVRYTVERINNVEYVTADQFQSGMQRAAQQGAQRGEQNTLKRLQLSSGTRRRLGI